MRNTTKYMRDYQRMRKIKSGKKNVRKFRNDLVDYVYLEILMSKPSIYQRYKKQKRYESELLGY